MPRRAKVRRASRERLNVFFSDDRPHHSPTRPSLFARAGLWGAPTTLCFRGETWDLWHLNETPVPSHAATTRHWQMTFWWVSILLLFLLLFPLSYNSSILSRNCFQHVLDNKLLSDGRLKHSVSAHRMGDCSFSWDVRACYESGRAWKYMDGFNAETLAVSANTKFCGSDTFNRRSSISLTETFRGTS